MFDQTGPSPFQEFQVFQGFSRFCKVFQGFSESFNVSVLMKDRPPTFSQPSFGQGGGGGAHFSILKAK